MPTPPRPRTRDEEPESAPAQPLSEPPLMRPIDVVFEKAPTEPAEIDKDAQQLLADAIAKAIASQLGKVRISSIPPSGPTSSIRAAAQVGGKVGQWSLYASGALSLIGSVIVWLMRPEYAAPLAQALKLIAGVIAAMAGGGTPAPDATPPRDPPALIAPAPAPAADPAQ